ncbi:MAG: ATP-binding cassette domain-containing protein [Pirellulaceae bacterium]|nr:ATP-binding cassette domain-containing protein [Planctomycetales bacterium]
MNLQVGRDQVVISACQLGRQAPESPRWLFRDVTFEIRAGQRWVMAGPSGAGKTILLRAMALLDPVDEGEIHWLGGPVAAVDIPVYRSTVMYVSQRPALVDGTVLDNLQLPFRLAAHRAKRYDDATVDRMLHALGRSQDFLQKRRRDLSGGEALLVTITRALQLSPMVLLLDEPTAALDALTQQQCERLVEQWLDEVATRTMVWVSHDDSQTRRIGRQRFYVSDGRLAVQADA